MQRSWRLPFCFFSNSFLQRFCTITYGKENEYVVSSLRVDRIASSGLGISRRNMDLAFLSKLLFLNGNVVTKKSIQVQVGDVIDHIRNVESTEESIKFDSVKVVEMGEETLKGKQRILLARKRGVIMEWKQFKDRFTDNNM
eukprot:Seg2241.10 transcript_id=Seg2241.10/GoldUCD/mRNA.D3Y31 product="putative protein C6orf203-like" protein_id=Seg2241.10/GoldUCD/D3Y31